MIQLKLAACVIAALMAYEPVPAATIVTYDIINGSFSERNGSQFDYLGWSHHYTGEVTVTGPDLSGFSANYSGGSGTLNDGIRDTTFGGESQLFYTFFTPPTITAFLDQRYQLEFIELYNAFANLDGAVVTVGNVSQFVPVSLIDEQTARLYLTGALAGQPTDTFTLSGFSHFTRNLGADYVTMFDIGEITVQGRAIPPVVPEPATWAMMLLGFGAVGFAMRRKRAVLIAYGPRLTS